VLTVVLCIRVGDDDDPMDGGGALVSYNPLNAGVQLASGGVYRDRASENLASAAASGDLRGVAHYRGQVVRKNRLAEGIERQRSSLEEGRLKRLEKQRKDAQWEARNRWEMTSNDQAIALMDVDAIGPGTIVDPGQTVRLSPQFDLGGDDAEVAALIDSFNAAVPSTLALFDPEASRERRRRRYGQYVGDRPEDARDSLYIPIYSIPNQREPGFTNVYSGGVAVDGVNIPGLTSPEVPRVYDGQPSGDIGQQMIMAEENTLPPVLIPDAGSFRKGETRDYSNWTTASERSMYYQQMNAAKAARESPFG